MTNGDVKYSDMRTSYCLFWKHVWNRLYLLNCIENKTSLCLFNRWITYDMQYILVKCLSIIKLLSFSTMFVEKFSELGDFLFLIYFHNKTTSWFLLGDGASISLAYTDIFGKINYVYQYTLVYLNETAAHMNI